MRRSLKLYRCGGGWGYRAKSDRKWCQSGMESLLFRQALWNGLCEAFLTWRWKIPRDRLCKPRRSFIGDDDWTLAVECGAGITRTMLHDPFRELPTDLDDEPQAFCPVHHTFERVWFTAGVLDPYPWYPPDPEDPGQLIFGGLASAHAPREASAP